MMWLKRLFSRRRLYGDLSEEIQEHLEEKIEELVASGMSMEEATYTGRREFGNVTLTKEDSREVWRWSAVENVIEDIRYGLRVLRSRGTDTGARDRGKYRDLQRGECCVVPAVAVPRSGTADGCVAHAAAEEFSGSYEVCCFASKLSRLARPKSRLRTDERRGLRQF
jgi:hypothetical protein